MIKQIKISYILGFFYFVLAFKLLFFANDNSLLPFPEVALSFMAYNLIFVGILLLPALFLYKNQRKYLLTIDILLTVMLLADSAYLRFYNTLPVLGLVGSTGLLVKQVSSIAKLFNFSDIIYLLDFIFILSVFFLSKKISLLKKLIPTIHKFKPKVAIFIALIVLILMSLVLARDSQARLPYLYGHISENKVVAKNIGVFGAHAIDISRNFEIFSRSLTQEEKNKVFYNIDKYRQKPTLNKFSGVAKDKRIIMIQFESLNNALIGAKIDGQEITPNLNQLAKSSSHFNSHNFVIGAGGTSDTDFCINTSLYPIVDSSVFVKHARDNFTSLEKELTTAGYKNYAYHANSRGYWNRDIAFKSLGFDEFFAEDDYKTGLNLNMGLSDKDFFNQSFDIIRSKPVKSFHYLITLTSHFSFELPDSEKHLLLKRGAFSSLSADYLQSIHYTDSALGDFINKLRSENIYQDSLIVLYGDHSAKYDVLRLDSSIIDPNTESGKYVPLMIKLPNQENGEVITTPSSHLDIMPTILNLSGASPVSPMFGIDLFSGKPSSYFTSSNENNFESILMDNYKYLTTDKSSTCSKEEEGSYVEVNPSDCSTIIDKRNIIQNNMNKLIKYNLFDDYLKQN